MTFGFISQYAWAIPSLPFFSALLTSIGLVSFRRSTNILRSLVAFLSLTTVALAFIFSCLLFFQLWFGGDSYRYLVNWVGLSGIGSAQNLILQFGFVIDPMSTLMLIIVTTVAFLVMLYSDSYMAYDESYIRFFVYLSLFTASMLGLVLSPNLIQLYFFWELVGMCSYLLIGFWYTRPSAGEAAQKAFITNRVGDFGFLLGILGFYWLTGSFNFDEIASHLMILISENDGNFTYGLLFSFLILLGPLSKSAQFPLHIWLPDAMEGPTPISALIHAATMVAAGIFLVARMFPIFSQFPIVLDSIAWIGGLTAVIGATIAVTQTDLKKGLAYSTVSQLGYMMMALGIGSPTASLFHLMTHAFSKALLFLGSGSVIHAMSDIVGNNPAINQNMQYMGGLRRFMPITSFTFLLGTLSICGFPPFSCFWSKDQILEEIFDHNIFLWLIAWLTAGLTSFYMFRLYFLTFEGNFRSYSKKDLTELPIAKVEPVESPFQMVACLLLLAVPTVFIGFLGTPFNNLFSSFLEFNVLPDSNLISLFNLKPEVLLSDYHAFFLTAGSSFGISLIGLTLSSLMYRENKVFSFDILSQLQSRLYSFFVNKWYLDDFYSNNFIQPVRKISTQVLKIDQLVIDSFINSIAFITLSTSQFFRFTQTGQVQVSFLLISICLILFGLFFSF